mmetsp:Transcript_49553/g.107323  ORF Transcript_49553/g.107323 Transcript_49553/m.107323 type:complete len:158 (+) Transcript_49553:198-671(+)
MHQLRVILDAVEVGRIDRLGHRRVEVERLCTAARFQQHLKVVAIVIVMKHFSNRIPLLRFWKPEFLLCLLIASVFGRHFLQGKASCKPYQSYTKKSLSTPLCARLPLIPASSSADAPLGSSLHQVKREKSKAAAGGLSECSSLAAVRGSLCRATAVP